jgi:hypothetical protein
MIMQIVAEMKVFSFIFCLSVLGFGNCFYVLSMINKDKCFINPDDPNCETFMGRNLLYGFLHSFRTGLGDFQPDEYD